MYIWENVYLGIIDRKFTLSVIVVFNSFTDVSFLKYVTKTFCISDYFQEKILCISVYFIV